MSDIVYLDQHHGDGDDDQLALWPGDSGACDDVWDDAGGGAGLSFGLALPLY